MTTAHPGEVELCPHTSVHFGSGDYYIICDACRHQWAQVGGQPEYGPGIHSPVGANPSLCQPGFNDTTPRQALTTARSEAIAETEAAIGAWHAAEIERVRKSWEDNKEKYTRAGGAAVLFVADTIKWHTDEIDRIQRREYLPPSRRTGG